MSSKPSKTGLLSRWVAWEVLKAVAAGAYTDVALKRVLRKHQLSSLDRKFAVEIAYGAIRQRHSLDCWLDFLGKVPARKQPPNLRWLLHLGIYQLLHMNGIPSSAAVNTTVELAKENKLSTLAPVVNGILRAVLRTKNCGEGLPLPSTPSERLAQLQSLPIWLASDLIRWQGEKNAEIIAKASNNSPACDLRVNRILSTPEKLQKEFTAVGIESVRIDGCPDGLQITQSCGDLSNLPGYSEGFWSVQDRSAQWVSPLLDVKPGEHVLDACAAPGGKATHIAELLGNAGEVWAVDRSRRRLKLASLNAARLRCSCLNFLVADSASLLDVKPLWKGYFQKIILDAPCSGLGTLARHPDARWRVTSKMINELVELQSKLLEGLLPLLSKGGRIVYATCTIHPDENLHQIESFISRHKYLNLVNQHQIWPGINGVGDGFYAAVLEYT